MLQEKIQKTNVIDSANPTDEDEKEKSRKSSFFSRLKKIDETQNTFIAGNLALKKLSKINCLVLPPNPFQNCKY